MFLKVDVTVSFLVVLEALMAITGMTIMNGRVFNDGAWTIASKGTHCTVMNGNQLYINGTFIRNLTADDQKELAEYQRRVEEWSANLGQGIQNEINKSINEFRTQMNAAFGPGGSFDRGFTGPFWNSVGVNTSQSTMMPLLPVQETEQIPEMNFPGVPAFCRQ